MSFRSQYDSPAIDLAGDALENIEVTVYESDGTTLATIYSNRTGGGTLANPITTGSTGLVQFWANPGTYVVKFHDTELPIRISDRQLYWEAVSGDDDSGGISLSQLTRGSGGAVIYSPSGASGQTPVWADLGSIVDTGDGKLKQTTGLAAATANLTLTTSYQNITGCSVTFTPDVACYALVQACFNFFLEDAGNLLNADCKGLLEVDGVDESAFATFNYLSGASDSIAEIEATVFQVYRVALNVSSHTLKLQAKKETTGLGSMTCMQTNTRMAYQLVAQ